MSRVFLADDNALGRAVVFKVLLPELAAGVNAERFKREVQLSARLQHPHIVPVLSAGEVDGLPYYVMPFVKGESLRARLAGGPLPIPEVVSILGDVSKALAYAQSDGIVHRDIKPDNVIVARRNAKVLDFGIAKQIGGNLSKDTPALTQGGMIVGTPYYMSPEQALGKTLDHRSDLFSLGVMLYEMLAGHRPFSGETMTETMMHIIMMEPPTIGSVAPSVPRGLREVVARCLQKHPDRRFGGAGELIEALDRIDYKDFEIPAPTPIQGKEKVATQPLNAAPPQPVEPVPGRRALVADEPALWVPRVHEDLTTKRVLAMDFARGLPIEELRTPATPQTRRDTVGTLLQRLLFREIFEFRFVQTDPNFANYLVEPETGRLLLLDFGATREYEAAFVAHYADLCRAVVREDRGAVLDAAVAIGYLRREDPGERQRAAVDLIFLICEPLRHRGAYDFARTTVAARARDAGFDLAFRHGFLRAPPPETLFLHRKLVGTFLLCGRIRACVDVRALLAPLLGVAS
jgi:tRNA A-37 threonylcarbamoyl transferase component Bud32